MAGRPSKYSPEVAKKVCDAIKLGASYELAAAYAGISEDSLSRWRARYADFAEQLRLSEGVGAIGWLARIEQAAASGDWRAAAWKLERRYPEQYGRTVQDQRHSDLRRDAEQVAEELGLDADARAKLIDYAAARRERRAG